MTLINRRALIALMSSTSVAMALRPAMAQETAPGATNLAQRMAAYAAGLRYADLDPKVIELAKFSLIDAMGCAIAAFNEAPIKAARSIAPKIVGPGATLVGTGQKTTADWAAFSNGSAVRHFDFNDVYAGKETGHPSDLIPAFMAACEVLGRSGADLILAIVLGYEINAQFLDAKRISSSGWDHPVYSLPAAALAVGRLFNLDAKQLTEAVNLSLSGHIAMNQTRSNTLTVWKGMANPESARAAVVAVELAKAGIEGPTPIFEGAAGFFKQISDGPLDIDVAKFGKAGAPFKINGVAIKFYPAQTQTMTAIAAAVAVAKKVGDLGQVKAIEIATTALGAAYAANEPEKWRPRSTETADHSLPYIVARAMVYGDITVHSFDPAVLDDPKVVALLPLTTVKEDPALTAAYPQTISNRVTAVLKDGRRVTEQVDLLPGFANKPMDRASLELKFQRNCAGLLGAKQQRQFLEFAWGLERQNSVKPLIASLAIAT